MNIVTSTDSPAGLAGSAKRSLKTPAEAPQACPGPVPPPENPKGEALSEQAAVHALVTSLKGDFQEMGLVPPPRNFAGVSLYTQPRDSEAQSGTLATMRLLMVKGIVSQLIVREESASQPAESAADTRGAEATAGQEQPHPVDLSL